MVHFDVSLIRNLNKNFIWPFNVHVFSSALSNEQKMFVRIAFCLRAILK